MRNGTISYYEQHIESIAIQFTATFSDFKQCAFNWSIVI